MIRVLLVVLAPALLAGDAIATQDDDAKAIAEKLSDPDARARRKAVQDLADDGSAFALGELVARALRDPDPMVADEAQLRLGRWEEQGVVTALTEALKESRKGDLFVRRVVEILGRVPHAIDGELLEPRLKDKDARLRRTVCWTVEQQARAGRLEWDAKKGKLVPRLVRLYDKDPDPGVRGSAYVALYAVDRPSANAARRPPVEAIGRAAVYATALRDRDSTWQAAAAAVEDDPSVAIRTRLVEALAGLRSKRGVLRLVGALQTEPEERLAWTIVAHLQRLSGQKHGRDSEAWWSWYRTLPDNWAPAEERGDTDLGDRTVALAGLPILSKRVAFLVDFSGSLWLERADGKTRKQAVDVELRRALEALPEDAEFNVIPYADDPRPWKDELVPATERNVQRALKDFEKNKLSGKGDFWHALEVALEDPRVDTVVVLTDGAPTGGEHWNLELMGMLFAERNRFRRVALDAVLVDTKPFLVELWRRMCEPSNGRVHTVDL